MAWDFLGGATPLFRMYTRWLATPPSASGRRIHCFMVWLAAASLVPSWLANDTRLSTVSEVRMGLRDVEMPADRVDASLESEITEG